MLIAMCLLFQFDGWSCSTCDNNSSNSTSSSSCSCIKPINEYPESNVTNNIPFTNLELLCNLLESE